MFKVIPIPYSDRNGYYGQRYVIDPESTDVKAVSKAGVAILAEHATHKANERALEAARKTLERIGDSARAEAATAGRLGEKVDKPKIKKRKREAAEALEDAELDYEGSSATMSRALPEYVAIVAHHAPALEAEARASAEHAILSAVTAVKLARSAQAEFDAASGVLAALPGAQTNEFIPRAPQARKRTSDDFGIAPVPGVQFDGAVTHLETGIGFAQRVLDELAADAETRAAEVAEDEADDVEINVEDEDDDEEGVSLEDDDDE